MTAARIALYPAGAHEWQDGGRDGLDSPLALSEIEPSVPRHVFDELARRYLKAPVFFRAVIPFHKSKWTKLRDGDLALFYKEGTYYAVAEIVAKWASRQLGEAIFGDNRTPKGELWELFCFFRNVRQVNIPKETINDALGYVQGRQLFGFTVVDADERVSAILHIVSSAV